MSCEQLQMEFAVLLYVVERHPEHLTTSDLVREMSGERDEDRGLRNAIHELKAFDLLRETAGVIEPTRAALHAAKILAL